MRRSISRVKRAESPAMKSQKSWAISRCSALVTLPTQGALHLSMYPSRHGRPDASARR